MNTFFTSDTHFGHANIIRFCTRPFTNIYEMDTELVKRWNEVIKPEDDVYHLGDFSFRGKLSPQVYKAKLNGKIYLVPGNHDKLSKYGPEFNILPPLYDIKFKDISITLCHYSMRVWNKSHYGAWQLYGHSHSTLKSYGKSLDVGVDNHNYYPWSFEEIEEYMNKQPANGNCFENLPGFDKNEFEQEKNKELHLAMTENLVTPTK